MGARTTAAIAAIALAAAGGGAALASSQPEAPATGPVSVSRPQALGAQMSGTVSRALDRGAPTAPKAVVDPLRELGVTEARLARQVDGRSVYLSKGTGDRTCLSVQDASGAVSSTCQDAEGVAEGMLWIGDGGNAQQKPETFSVVPDGVATVTFTAQDATEADATVQANVAAAQTPTDVVRIQFADKAGAHADLRIPGLPAQP